MTQRNDSFAAILWHVQVYLIPGSTLFFLPWLQLTVSGTTALILVAYFYGLVLDMVRRWLPAPAFVLDEVANAYAKAQWNDAAAPWQRTFSMFRNLYVAAAVMLAVGSVMAIVARFQNAETPSIGLGMLGAYALAMAASNSAMRAYAPEVDPQTLSTSL